VEFKVSGAAPQYIDMPTFCTHDITNTGQSDLTTLFWAHEIFDPQRSDTIREPVES
jgi:UDP-2-acetamido-2,6-beta-L-arabino-hexul-4-ose reductase